MTSTRVVSVAAALVVALAATLAHAQARPEGSKGDARQAPGSLSVPTTSPGDAPSDAGVSANGSWAPVLMVTNVEIMRSTRPPVLDIIRVRGISSTDTWDSPQIVPLTHGPSADGVLELMFIAQAPSEGITPTNYGTLEAIFVVGSGHPYKGVRVRGARNSVSVTQLPGYAEVVVPKVDCRDCIGKFFVAKGQPAPAGRAAGDIVLEADLPVPVRVIGATQGVEKLDADPNRLTLLLGTDGRIVSAVWD
jgi:hypothetical protein